VLWFARVISFVGRVAASPLPSTLELSGTVVL